MIVVAGVCECTVVLSGRETYRTGVLVSRGDKEVMNGS